MHRLLNREAATGAGQVTLNIEQIQKWSSSEKQTGMSALLE